MVDSVYNPGNNKSLKISIAAIIRNPELLRFVSDHLKSNKMCKNSVLKLPFVIRYFPDK